MSKLRLGCLLVVAAFVGVVCSSMGVFRSTCPPAELEQVDECSGHEVAFLQGHSWTLEASGRPKQSYCRGNGLARPLDCEWFRQPKGWRCEGQFWPWFLRVAAYAPDCSTSKIWIQDAVQEPRWLDSARQPVGGVP